MRKAFFLSVFCALSCTAAMAQYSVKVVIDAMPPKHDGDAIYEMGNFNGWNPNDPGFQFAKDSSGKYALFFPSVPGDTYELKLTRGSKETTECAADGKDIPNRQVTVSSDTTFRITVAGWMDDFAKKAVAVGK